MFDHHSEYYDGEESTYVYVLMFPGPAFQPRRPVVGKGVVAYIPILTGKSLN